MLFFAKRYVAALSLLNKKLLITNRNEMQRIHKVTLDARKFFGIRPKQL